MQIINRLPLLPRIVIALILGVLLGGVMPDWCVRVFNTFNGVFDQLLRFIIPLIIVGFWNRIMEMRENKEN